MMNGPMPNGPGMFPNQGNANMIGNSMIANATHPPPNQTMMNIPNSSSDDTLNNHNVSSYCIEPGIEIGSIIISTSFVPLYLLLHYIHTINQS